MKRIKLITSGSDKVIDYNYNSKLCDFIYRTIGFKNQFAAKWHNGYSFSWLYNGTAVDEGIIFKNGAVMYINSIDDDIITSIERGLINNSDLFDGLSVVDMQYITPNYDNEIFFTKSPVVVSTDTENGRSHYSLYTEQDSNDYLYSIMIDRMERVGIDTTGFDISFHVDSSCVTKTKLVHFGEKFYISNCVPVQINGTDRQKEFCMGAGVGTHTHLGFGCI